MQPTAVRPAVAGGLRPTSHAAGAVLLVTNDGDLRDVASRVLRNEGYEVLCAAHGGHALLACMQADVVDVAVIEMSMDDMSGPALAERLRRCNPRLRAIYVAQPGTPECEGVLVRPFTREDLLAKLESISASERALRQSVR